MDEEAMARAIAKGNIRAKERERAYGGWLLCGFVLAVLVGWVASVLLNGWLGGLAAGTFVFCIIAWPLHRWYVGD